MEPTSFNGDIKNNTVIPDDVYVMKTSPKVNKISLLPFITRFIRHKEESTFSETQMLGCFPDIVEPLPMSRRFLRCRFPETNKSSESTMWSNPLTNTQTEDLPAMSNPYPASTIPSRTEAGSLNYTNFKTRKFECEICGKRSTTKRNLVVHTRIHTDRTKVECEICCKKFATESVLAVHMRIHTGDRPYKCPQCNLRFSDTSTFAKHKRMHSGHKPYKCNVCNKAFGQSGNLLRHRRSYNH